MSSRTQGLGGFDLHTQFVGQNILLFEGFHDCLAPLVQVAETGEPVPDRRDHDLVEGAGGFLPVTGNERDRGAVLQEVGYGLDLGGTKGALGSDLFEVGLFHDVRIFDLAK